MARYLALSETQNLSVFLVDEAMSRRDIARKDMAILEVRVAVPISYRMRLAVGDRLTIAGGEGTHAGVVRTLIGTGDPVSQTFELHVDLVESERELVMPGQLVKVEIPLEASQMTLAVPRDAVVIRSEGSYIYRVSAEGVAERVSVAVGAGQAHLVAVSGELEEGQRIVVRGGDRLREGQKVSEQGQAEVNLQS